MLESSIITLLIMCDRSSLSSPLIYTVHLCEVYSVAYKQSNLNV